MGWANTICCGKCGDLYTLARSSAPLAREGYRRGSISLDEQHSANDQPRQTILDPAKVVAIGIASPTAAFLTSRFGIAGTLVGLAASAVIITVVTDLLKVYVARTSHAAALAAHRAAHTSVTTKGPRRRRGLLVRLFRRKSRAGSKRAFRGFSRLPHPRRGSVLIGSVLTAGISFLLGLGVVTAIELSVGQSLACWAWKECPVEPSSAEDGEETEVNTRPSVLGGTSASSETPEVQPLNPQQPPALPLGREVPGPGVQPTNPEQPPTLPSNLPESPQPPPSEGPSLESSGSDEAPQEAWNQPSPQAEEDEQQQDSSSYYYFEEDQHEQQSPPSTGSKEPQPPEGRGNSGSSTSDEESWEPDFSKVLFTT